jgi:nucleoside diphosphate kinase
MGSGASKSKTHAYKDGAHPSADAHAPPSSSSCKDGKKSGDNSAKLMNSAFVFIKPHANNLTTQTLVSTTLKARGLQIVKEGEFKGEDIDKGMLIDQHYYAIASKATILKANQIPVPGEKFQESFGSSWETALSENRAFNAIDARNELGVDTAGLDALWSNTNKVKFGGGFYCGEIKREDGKPSIFVFNAFFMTMRNKFVAPNASIHYFVVEFDPDILSWKDFRGKVLGSTDPKNAPADSLRGKMLVEWQELGLHYEPNVSDNCVHASASPFEGLAERMNWLKVEPNQVCTLK